MKLKNIVLYTLLVIGVIVTGIYVARLIHHLTPSRNVIANQVIINTPECSFVKIIKQYEVPVDSTLTSYKIISACIDNKYVILSPIYGGYIVEVVYNNGIPQSCDE